MTKKKRNADEFSSGFERDKDSIRSQLLEGTIENYKRISSETIVDTKEKAEQSFMQYCELSSRIRNTIFTLYPKSDDGGEVVAMGTEDSNACGLLEDLEGPRLYGKFSLFLPLHGIIFLVPILILING